MYFNLVKNLPFIEFHTVSMEVANIKAMNDPWSKSIMHNCCL